MGRIGVAHLTFLRNLGPLKSGSVREASGLSELIFRG